MSKEIFVIVSENAEFPGFTFEGTESSLEGARDYALTIAGTFASDYEKVENPGRVRTSLGYYNTIEAIGNKDGDAYWRVCILRTLVS